MASRQFVTSYALSDPVKVRLSVCLCVHLHGNAKSVDFIYYLILNLVQC